MTCTSTKLFQSSCLSVPSSGPSCPFDPLSIPAVVSQNITNKRSLVCVNDEKFAFLVTFRSLGSVTGGETDLCTIRQTKYIIVYMVVEFHGEKVKFNRLLKPNEHIQRTF